MSSVAKFFQVIQTRDTAAAKRMLAAEPELAGAQRKRTIGFVADRVQRQQGTLRCPVGQWSSAEAARSSGVGPSGARETARRGNSGRGEDLLARWVSRVRTRRGVRAS